VVGLGGGVAGVGGVVRAPVVDVLGGAAFGGAGHAAAAVAAQDTGTVGVAAGGGERRGALVIVAAGAVQGPDALRFLPGAGVHDGGVGGFG